MDQDILDAKINESGRHFIRRMASFSTVLFLLVLFNSGVSLFSLVRILIQLLDDSSPLEPMFHWSRTVIHIVLLLLAVAASWFYTMFPAKVKKALQHNDEQALNDCFRWLYIGVLIYFVQFFLGGLQLLYDLLTM